MPKWADQDNFDQLPSLLAGQVTFIKYESSYFEQLPTNQASPLIKSHFDRSDQWIFDDNNNTLAQIRAEQVPGLNTIIAIATGDRALIFLVNDQDKIYELISRILN